MGHLPLWPDFSRSTVNKSQKGTHAEFLTPRSRFLEHGYKAGRGTLTKPVVELTGKRSGETLESLVYWMCDTTRGTFHCFRSSQRKRNPSATTGSSGKCGLTWDVSKRR